ncbi:expressed unknown protein [Seminavis robusta]|uniref:JmjC domain-containing protein n=1 Tax=Seminavis robusta TaxID=568900 RepID=A0A9N8E8R4_9STRA|nr:expressed unknown protein [Seminavis robusta]|eukprot:Sro671_g184780.2  (286) ;mRNA; r:3211-4068
MRSTLVRRRVLLQVQRYLRHYYSTTSSKHGEALAEYRVTKEDTDDTITDTVRPYFERQEPLVLRDLLSNNATNQRAMTELLPNWDFWQRTVDESTDCHVELGGNYASEKSQTVDVPFREFLEYLQYFEDRFGRTPSQSQAEELPQFTDLIYMAQNDLFDEIHPFIDIPSLTKTLGEQQSLYSTMIWMGPHGCVSPLHFDPLDNLLLQFVGTKQFLLCPPTSPVPPGNQPNTSSWDPSSLDDENHNSNLQVQHSTLNAGDAIYIPKKWYHHVATVETSVSINTWFR